MNDNVVQIGADEAFRNEEKTAINFEGENFYRACGAIVRTAPSGDVTHCVKRVHHPGVIHEDYFGYSIDGSSVQAEEEHQPDDAVDSRSYSEEVQHLLETQGEITLTLTVGCKTRREVDTAMDILLQPLLTLASQEGRYAALSLYNQTDPST